MSSAPVTVPASPGVDAAPQLGGAPSGRQVLTMLLLRLVAFAAAQAVVALLLAAGGSVSPWADSAAWWPLTATAANVLTLTLLARRMRAEGASLRDLYRPDRARVRRDVPAALLVTLAGAALAAGPNMGLATLLWGDPQVSLDLLVRPLPLAAAVTSAVLFPVTTALAELPTYYAYVQPRLAALGRGTAVVVAAPALLHALQHVTLPLLLDARFLVWRALMFLPFTLLLAVVLRRRPSLLPYLLVVHLLLDAQMGVLVLLAAS
ncbi:hypothetical protein GC089_14675 [Cellulomonas sp. JZ18]|uniref:hypothetical protein n=1 Tax=Cellulomonas sp. JZ18 TaxID=2654191 RepID=UPI0012D4A10E|nr:hypothetical protein [Cellulomonas sp. JZ18]QGQ20216.1 hypothetical protein GC089_14675 [Cellulomonas sp. JZ18]